MPVRLLFDCNYLAHRAYHSTGGLRHEGEATGVAFGVLRDIEGMREQFGAAVTALAWDYGGPGLRAAANPGYKATRDARAEEWTDAERESRRMLQEQILKLRSQYLPEMGYRNIFFERGYEADDILAALAADAPAGDDTIIVSADKDLWQCLAANVWCYNPTTKQFMTAGRLAAEYHGIHPAMWASVKALAGCPTDDIAGIAGVGEQTAAAYYAGKLKHTTKKYQAISANLDVHNRNIALTRLPYPGLVLPPLRPDEFSEEGRVRVFSSLGIRHDRRPRQPVPVGRFFDPGGQ